LRRLGAVVVIMAGLTAGWPLLDTLVSGRQPVAANTTFTIGPRGAESARVTVGPGWSMQRAQTNPRRDYTLSIGVVRVSVLYVAPVSAGDAAELWPGLQTILRLSHPGARLSAPELISSAYGQKGLAGRVSGRGLAGRIAIFPDLARRFAIEMVVFAPAGARLRQVVAAQSVMRSIRFPPGRP
jgi:hypothetical protein